MAKMSKVTKIFNSGAFLRKLHIEKSRDGRWATWIPRNVSAEDAKKGMEFADKLNERERVK
jgi:hypothetical protein